MPSACTQLRGGHELCPPNHLKRAPLRILSTPARPVDFQSTCPPLTLYLGPCLTDQSSNHHCVRYTFLSSRLERNRWRSPHKVCESGSRAILEFAFSVSMSLSTSDSTTPPSSISTGLSLDRFCFQQKGLSRPHSLFDWDSAAPQLVKRRYCSEGVLDLPNARPMGLLEPLGF